MAWHARERRRRALLKAGRLRQTLRRALRADRRNSSGEMGIQGPFFIGLLGNTRFTRAPSSDRRHGRIRGIGTQQRLRLELRLHIPERHGRIERARESAFYA